MFPNELSTLVERSYLKREKNLSKYVHGNGFNFRFCKQWTVDCVAYGQTNSYEYGIKQ